MSPDGYDFAVTELEWVEQQHEVWELFGSDGCDLVVAVLGWKGEKHQILLMATGRHR